MAKTSPAGALTWLPWLAVALLLTTLAFITPVNHDEDQYVAAAWARAQGLRPFGDFMYLQTPLQPWLTALIFSATEGWSFIALRLVNAAAGLLTLVFVYARLRADSVDQLPALATTALLASCVPFLFSASLARNDALPAMLLALTLWRCHRDRWYDWALAGLALGLAASFKISYGLPLAAAGFWLLFRWLRAPSSPDAAALIAYGAAGFAGLAPTALSWAAHPTQFEYGVFTYAAEGARIWYDLNGVGDKLLIASRARDSVLAMMMGPALFALLIVVFSCTAVSARNGRAIVTVLTGAGLVAALLPTPTYRQYFLVMLPPLFVLLGTAHTAWWFKGWKLWTLVSLASASIIIYLGIGAQDCARPGTPLNFRVVRAEACAFRGSPAAVRVVRQAHWIGDTMRVANLPGPIVTFSPSYVIDSGIPLDLRFTTGVHVWRSADLRSDAEQRAFNVTSRRTLTRELERLPPAAIFTGFEGRSGVNRRIVPDDALNDWARANGYRAQPTPYGGLLWLRQR